jgi:hypothetical protein
MGKRVHKDPVVTGRGTNIEKEVIAMLSSYPVACPHANCTWTGSLVPSHLRGGADAEIASMHRAWFHCPSCHGDWEVRITDDRVTVLPRAERPGGFQDRQSSKPARAVAFDIDSASLASLREALAGWEIDSINGASPASLAQNWDSAGADLLVVSAGGNITEILRLCRFLTSSCTGYSTEIRDKAGETLGAKQHVPGLLLGAPLVVLVPAGQEVLVEAALEAGARSCLVLPIHPKDVASMLAHTRAGNQPGRHTLNLDQAQVEDHWRDDGGQG